MSSLSSSSFECAICQENVEDAPGGDFNLPRAIETTSCGHVFHRHCLSMWLKDRNNRDRACPNCRQKVAANKSICLFPDDKIICPTKTDGKCDATERTVALAAAPKSLTPKTTENLQCDCDKLRKAFEERREYLELLKGRKASLEHKKQLQIGEVEENALKIRTLNNRICESLKTEDNDESDNKEGQKEDDESDDDSDDEDSDEEEEGSEDDESDE